MSLPSIPHHIERTGNKHSRAVLRDDTIVIRLARNLTWAEEHLHIENLLRRMRKHLLRERERTFIDPFRPLLSGAESCSITLASGRSYTFTLTPGTRARARRTMGGWRVEVSSSIRSAHLHRFLWSLLAASELPSVSSLVSEINSGTLRVSVGAVRLRYASSQWGSCSHSGAISLNPAILLVPPELLRYLIIHELAHRLHPNHSRAYWRTVAGACPEYAAFRTMLGKHRICSL